MSPPVFPLESKKRMYTHILTQNLDVYSLLTAITLTILDVLDLFCGRQNVRLGINGNSGPPVMGFN